MPPTIKRHYVARVVVTRVEKTLIPFATGRQQDITRAEASREVEEIASLTFNGASALDLAEKIKAHVDIILDGEADAGA